MSKKVVCILSLFISSFLSIEAAVTPNNLFCDNAVLQRGMEVPVWGWAKDGEKVTVEFAGQKVTTVANHGKWMVKLNAMKENTIPQDLLIKGENTVVVKNVLIGEVWLCCGQSNMEWALSNSVGGIDASASSTNPNLRIFNVPHAESVTPNDTVNAKWEPSEPRNTKQISAIGYWFSSKLQKELGVPVGFINASWGGTPIEAWISQSAIEKVPNRDNYTYYDSAKIEYEKKMISVMIERDKWLKAKDSARINKLPIPRQPRGAMIGPMRGPTTIFNGEIHPLMPFAIRGIAWYQGENNSNIARAGSYGKLLPIMINSWRSDWGQPQLPFIIFQLSSWGIPQVDPNNVSGIAVVQEAQLNTFLKMPNTALIVTQDMAESNVHYTQKEPIAQRALNAALFLAYKKPVPYLGPIFKSMNIDGNKVILDFDHASNGLLVKGDTLHGFVICGSDRKFVFATARVVKNKVIVSSEKISHPIAVRYGWADFPKVNLFNKEGMPASPFRTDK